jgi:hypothetical protein
VDLMLKCSTLSVRESYVCECQLSFFHFSNVIDEAERLTAPQGLHGKVPAYAYLI